MELLWAPAGEARIVHRLKQNFIFSLVHWKRSLPLVGIQAMHNDTSVSLHQMLGQDCCGRLLSRELSGITTPHFAYGVQLWVKSLIPLTGKQYKMKEHCEKSPIPFFLQTSLSLSYLLHNSMLKEIFGKALKCKNKKQDARRKNKLNRKKWREISWQ